ncbi:PP2C family protein-serine/threonine phosphatase [Paraburkholderia ribeironis]|uniref:PP2C family protein-serine/threonine phosphatase n=1 Tax=Paraburkholderia ribeironis TaxID=1247936 RepID=UPI001178CAEC|nr:protein phosphatase 2C domain-containing protein [Paraburkholderia ribeironis]
MTSTHARRWSVGQRSETGYVRSENQDRMSWIRTSAADVFVVSDGMGGHAGGATAATLTVQVLQDELQALDSLAQADQALVRALQTANAAVHARGQTPNPALAGMGATAVVLLAAGERIMLAHVGDSRAYRLDRHGVLHRLTKDHSVVQRMVDAGTLSSRDAEHHPDASLLERALGQAPHVTVDVSGWITVRRGELCMLCSDGLCGYVDDHAIASAMREGGAPQTIADRLVLLALHAGGEDNVTVQVLRCGEEHRANWRRWIGRGALAALCAAAAAMVWSGWLGFSAGRDDTAGGPVQAAGTAAARAGRFVTAPAASAAASRDASIAALERARQAIAERFLHEDALLMQKLDALLKERDAARGDAAAAAAASGALVPAKVASEAHEVSAAGARNAAVAANAVQGVNPTLGASASRASNDTSTTRAQSNTTRHPAAAIAHKPPAKRAQRPTPRAVAQEQPASAANASNEPQSADSDGQTVEIKQ